LNAASIEPHSLSCLVYVADSIASNNAGAERGSSGGITLDIRSRLASICQRQIQTNGGVIPGQIDGIALATTPNDKAHLYGGYEDEETRLAMEVVGGAAVALSHSRRVDCANASGRRDGN
jgi:hypothetical protein